MNSYFSYCNGEQPEYEGTGGISDQPSRPGLGQPPKKSKLRVWGSHNYNFDFRTQGESLY